MSANRERMIPGTELNGEREFRYVSHASASPFADAFKRLARFVDPPIPTHGGAMIERCTISLPSGGEYHAISYRGDIVGWRKQLAFGAQALGLRLAEVVGDAMLLEDGAAVPLHECRVEFY